MPVDHPLKRPHIAGRAAVDGLRMYWRGAAITAGTATGALSAALVVTFSLTLARGSMVPRLALTTVRDSTLGFSWNPTFTTTVATLQHRVLGTLFGMLIAVALGATVVALITIFAVSAARAAQRAPEIAVRRAVGASRWRIAQTAFVEGAIISGGVIVAGAVIGAMVGWIAVSAWPGTSSSWHAGPTAFAAAVVSATIMVGALFTLVPSRGRTIRETSGKSPALHAAGFQLGVALLVLMMGAMLLQKSADMTRTPPAAGSVGANARTAGPPGIVMQLPTLQLPPADRAARYATLLSAFGDSTQYADASLSSPGSLVGLGTVSGITTLCGQCFENGMYSPRKYPQTSHQFVSTDTFHSLGLAIVSGRNFTASDRWNTEPVAIVNSTLARRHFQDGNPLGRKLEFAATRQWYTVIGVVDDVRPSGFGGALEPQFTVYFDVLQFPPATTDLLLRPQPGVNTAAIEDTVARALGLPAATLRRMSEADLLRTEMAPLAWFGRWIAFEGWAMLLLAAAGAFTLMQLWVTGLRPELGIRRAAGARQRQIIAWILERAALAGLGGIALAVWFAPASHYAVSTVVENAPGWDAQLFGRYAVGLVAISLLGAFLPAWRASRADPVALLEAADG